MSQACTQRLALGRVQRCVWGRRMGYFSGCRRGRVPTGKDVLEHPFCKADSDRLGSREIERYELRMAGGDKRAQY